MKHLKALGMAVWKVTGATSFSSAWDAFLCKTEQTNRTSLKIYTDDLHTHKYKIIFWLISWSLWNDSCLQHLTNLRCFAKREEHFFSFPPTKNNKGKNAKDIDSNLDNNTYDLPL